MEQCLDQRNRQKPKVFHKPKPTNLQIHTSNSLALRQQLGPQPNNFQPAAMSPILAVFGATGQQGASVITHVLNDPTLSQTYQIRAITRSATSEKAQRLLQNNEKVQVVEADIHNRASLERALTDAHTIFAMTVPDFGPDGFQTEYDNGTMIVDVAVERGASYLIFSTLPSVNQISGGKYKSAHFDAKAEVERYIRGLPIKSAFISLGTFMTKFHTFFATRPSPSDNGTFLITGVNTPTARKMPLIDVTGDTGKFVGAILADPEKYAGATFCAAVALYSWDDVAAAISKVTGKRVEYRQVSVEEFKTGFPFDDVIDGLVSVEEFGYWGAESEKLVAWAAENARGKLSGLEEYMAAHPPRLGGE